MVDRMSVCWSVLLLALPLWAGCMGSIDSGPAAEPIVEPLPPGVDAPRTPDTMTQPVQPVGPMQPGPPVIPPPPAERVPDGGLQRLGGRQLIESFRAIGANVSSLAALLSDGRPEFLNDR